MDSHNDLLADRFPNEYLQAGSDGVIVGTSVPCTFSSSSLALNHYIPDCDAETLDNEAQRVKTLSSNVDYVLPVLNIPTVGFFRITEVLTNQSCTIDYMSPSIQLIINRGLRLDLNATAITAATGLSWSLGGKEEKIALAYADLVTELIKRKAITADFIDSDDPSYVQALRYHSLQLVYMALIAMPDDNASRLTSNYYHLYQKELTTAKPYGYAQKATQMWTRG